MKRAEQTVSKILPDINGKTILEVACGCAEFSVAAAKYAKEVHCMDIDDNRLPKNIGEYTNIFFRKTDASAMDYEDESFNTAILYNAIGHLEKLLSKAIFESLRVICNSGCLYIISSSKMDKFVIENELLPFLAEQNIPYSKTEDKIFTWVKILKDETV